MQWRGEFIWTPDQPIEELPFRRLIGDGPTRRDDGKNRWAMFRKTFSVDEQLENASVDITVDGAYLLFVNGRRVGRGPTRSAPSHKLYDSYDLSPLLNSGKNAIAVLVHVYGIDTAWYETSKDYWQALFGDGGLYCVAFTAHGQGQTLFETDSSWRCMEAKAWNRDTPLSGWGQDFIEDYDARQEVMDWTSVEFDDSDWSCAQELVDSRDADDHAKGFGPIRPFPVLRPSSMPPAAEAIISPAEIIAVLQVNPRPELPINERLYAEEVQSLIPGDAEKFEPLLNDDDQSVSFHTTNETDIGLLVKFDTLYSGYPFIELEGSGGEVVELAVSETFDGEFNGEKSVVPRIVRSSFLDGAHVFRYTARSGAQKFEKFEWTSARYLQVVVRNAPNGLKIRHVGIRSCHFPAEPRGSFRCSDSFLEELWQTARYTVLQCSHDAWEDCPGREKRQWLGDGVSRYPVAAAAFGTSMQPLDRLFLHQAAHAQRNDGLMQMYAPGDHKTSGVVIPDYSLHYILIVHDYLLHTGDIQTVNQVWPAIPKSLAWFEHFVDERGLLTDIPHWHFIEWANMGRIGTAGSINALHAAALKSAAAISRHLEFPRIAERYDNQYRTRRAAMNKYFWDDERNVYVDSLDPRTGEQGQQVSQHANALALLFDIAPTDHRDEIIRYITDPNRTKLTAVPPVVPHGEAFDPEQDVVRCNSFFSHFLYSALGHCGRTDTALQLIREHYAPMLESGTGTLWESFDPSASLCHAFSATPLYQLSAYVLGVRPSGPGFDEFTVSPQFCDLASAEGSYPTPVGPIKVAWQRQDGHFDVRITVPNGLVGTFVSPTGFSSNDGNVELDPGTHELRLQQGNQCD